MAEEEEGFISNKVIRRKVQVVGGNTITVSLPRSWADHNRLGKDPGMEQEIAMRYMADGSLLLSPANTTGKHVERERIHRILSTTSIDVVKRILIADFMGGIDHIRIVSKTEIPRDMRNEITNFVDKRLLGFDLIETENGFDVINMTQSPKFPVDKLLEIIRVQSKQMMQNCYQWFKDRSVDRKKLAEDMHLLEVTIDKRAIQMMRTLQLSVLDYWMAENVNLPMAEILYWSTVTKAVENASDLTVAITDIAPTIDLDELDPSIIDEMYELGTDVTDMFSRSIDSFIKHDHEMAHMILEEQDELSATTQKKWPIDSAHMLKGNMVLILRHLEKISVYARKIAEAVIDCEASRVAYVADDLFDY